MMNERSDQKPKGRESETLAANAYEAEDVFAGAEPWVAAETKMVAYSFVAAVIALLVFGALINIFLLG